jgi:hypothetical protein
LWLSSWLVHHGLSDFSIWNFFPPDLPGSRELKNSFYGPSFRIT